MAKFYGSGVKTGKVGASVFAIRSGEVIERQYQPVVSNPSTPAQVEARAKLKLLSQLGAVMKPAILMPKKGNVSSRNLFTKKNYRSATFADNAADISLTSIKLTDGVVSVPMPYVTSASTATSLQLELNSSDIDVSRIIYAVFKKDGSELRLAGIKSVDTPGPNNTYPTSFSSGLAANDEVVVYVYGVRDNTEAARALYDRYRIEAATYIAALAVTRTLTESDVTITETRAITHTMTAGA